MFIRVGLAFLLFFTICTLMAQNVTVEGYVFEDGNRGYLNLAKVTIIDKVTGMEKAIANTDTNGKFVTEVPSGGEYIALIDKDLFKKGEEEFSTVGKTAEDKIFLKVRMVRKPGYIFDVTLAEKREDVDKIVDAISGANIEVYNNTKENQIVKLPNHKEHTFKVHFEDGNHYTILIRKPGFFNKRMEAFVNVKGCILCFEGVGEVKPSDVLSEGNTMGTLVANVELERIKMNEGMKLENIYYEYASAELNDAAKFELDKLINLLNNNPVLIVELGSHTDSRGNDDYNYELSGQRAISAVDYVIANSTIDRNRIRPSGYGESTPTNKCKNGVTCSEQEHAVNRRTELKIVGTLGTDPFENKTLADIIADEKMEELLAEIMNADAVRVVDGEDLPDEIKKQFEGKDKDEETKEDAKDKIAESTEIEAVIEMPATPEIIESEIVEEVMEEEIVEVEEVAKEVADRGETMLEEIDRVEEQNTTESAPVIETPETPQVVEAEVIQERVIEEPMVATSQQSGPTSGTKIFTEYEISTPKPYRQAKAMEANYTGYRVELIQSAAELPGSHDIFYRHGNVIYDQNKDGSYSYMLGAFGEAEDAKDFLENIILAQYPRAQVVRYKKGNRING